MERLQSITVLGGSAASSFNDVPEKSWPYLLKNSLPQHIDFRVETRGGLTFVRAISELADFPNEDLLIFHSKIPATLLAHDIYCFEILELFFYI